MFCSVRLGWGMNFLGRVERGEGKMWERELSLSLSLCTLLDVLYIQPSSSCSFAFFKFVSYKFQTPFPFLFPILLLSLLLLLLLTCILRVSHHQHQHYTHTRTLGLFFFVASRMHFSASQSRSLCSRRNSTIPAIYSFPFLSIPFHFIPHSIRRKPPARKRTKAKPKHFSQSPSLISSYLTEAGRCSVLFCCLFRSVYARSDVNFFWGTVFWSFFFRTDLRAGRRR